jgi:hypothetical protein
MIIAAFECPSLIDRSRHHPLPRTTSSLLKNCLCGRYVNFSVFRLYADPCWAEALTFAFAMVQSIPPEDLMAYSKLSSAVFAFLDALSSEQLFRLDGLEEGTVLLILRSCAECLRHFDRPASVQACSILENMASFVYQRRRKPSTGAGAGVADGSLPITVEVFDRHPDLVPFLLGRLLEIVLTEDLPNCWSYSRPILPLILLMGSERFEELVQRLVSVLAPEVRDPVYKVRVEAGDVHEMWEVGCCTESDVKLIISIPTHRTRHTRGTLVDSTWRA